MTQLGITPGSGVLADEDRTLRLPMELLTVFLILAGVAVYVVADGQLDRTMRNQLLNLSLVLPALAGLSWIAEGLRGGLGRWMACGTLALLVHIADLQMGVPGLIVLVIVPILVGMMAVGRQAMLAMGAIETGIFLAWPNRVAAGLGSEGSAAVLVAMWCMIAAVFAIHQWLDRRHNTLQAHTESALLAANEARDSKLRLEQTANALEYATRQLMQTNERVAKLRAVAEDAERTKTLFVAQVSHEFRTPLNMIIGLSELLVDTPEIYSIAMPSEMKHDLAVILRNCRHLSGLIDDVLDLTRIESGRVVLRKERVALEPLVRDSVAAVVPLIEKKRLAVTTSIPDELPLVYCDGTRIRQVILNLVSNAARHTDEGSIAVRVVKQDHHVVVTVTDTGHGINPSDVERIFEPFVQVSGFERRDHGGSGLGLSISQQFIKLHGGRMWVKSQPDEGSTFGFELPISPPVEPTGTPSRWIREDWIWRQKTFRMSAGRLATQRPKPRMVVCDPIGSLASGMRRFADQLDIIGLQDPDQLATILKEAPADVVVVNVDEDEILAWPERLMSSLDDTPLVLCAVQDPARKAHGLGAVDYIVKPVARHDLDRAIASLNRPVTRALIVDDDDGVRNLLKRMLFACSSEIVVDMAGSGQQALDMMESGAYEMMLLDVLLPDMDGWEVLERMKEQQRRSDSSRPSVFIVSAQDPEDRPFTSHLLVATVRRGLTLSQLVRASLQMSETLLSPHGSPAPVLRPDDEAAPAWAESMPHPAQPQVLLPE